MATRLTPQAETDYNPISLIRIANGHATNAGEDARQGSLAEVWPYDVQPVPTAAKREVTISRIHEAARPLGNIAVEAEGGDYAGYIAGNAMLHRQAPANLREATLFLTPTGNKNVLAAMVNRRRTPAELFKRGRTRDFHPLRYSFTPDPETGNPDAFQEGFAMFCLSVGKVTVRCAQDLNNPEFRKAQADRTRFGKWIAQYVMIAKNVLRSKPFQTKNGPVFDLLFSNGSIVGGQRWFRGVDLFSDTIVESATKDNWWSKGTGAARRLMRLGRGKRRRGDYEAVVELLDNETPIQFDGETGVLLGPGTLRVGRSEASIRLRAA